MPVPAVFPGRRIAIPSSDVDRSMLPVVIELRNAEDWRDVVHQAVQAFAEGKLVAFPTETVYGAFGQRPGRGGRRAAGGR